MLTRKDFLLSIIQDIGIFQMQYFGKEITFETKQNDLDFVSFVDIESQKIFTEGVKKSFGNDIVMGEEGYDSARDYSKEEHLWIIDPVDGTLLYKRGIPLFGIMIAYVHNGHIELSAILLPSLNELYHADENGAYRNSIQIDISSTKSLSSSVIQVSSYSLNTVFNNAEDLKKYFRGIGIGFDAYSMAYATTACASGKIDGGAFYPDYGGIWDTVPGGFLIQQAGGHVSTFGQNDWDIWDKNIIFSNGVIHHDLQEILKSH